MSLIDELDPEELDWVAIASVEVDKDRQKVIEQIEEQRSLIKSTMNGYYASRHSASVSRTYSQHEGALSALDWVLRQIFQVTPRI